MKTDEPDCTVLTFKEGLLSRVAHDLKLRVHRFGVDGDASTRRLTATADPASLRVVCAMLAGRESPATLSASDCRKIDQSIATDVLEATRHPTIRFQSEPITVDGDKARIDGVLTLHGVSRPLHLDATRTDGTWYARVALHQPDFGIRPFTALMGTLRVRPEVTVVLRIPDRPEWHAPGR